MPLSYGALPLLRGSIQREIDQFRSRFIAWEMAPGANSAADFGIERFYCIRNRYEDAGADVRSCFSDQGVCCEHPGQRHREHEGAGRPIHTMSCELVLVAGRLCDSPGCAESADP